MQVKERLGYGVQEHIDESCLWHGPYSTKPTSAYRTQLQYFIRGGLLGIQGWWINFWAGVNLRRMKNGDVVGWSSSSPQITAQEYRSTATRGSSSSQPTRWPDDATSGHENFCFQHRLPSMYCRKYSVNGRVAWALENSGCCIQQCRQ